MDSRFGLLCWMRVVWRVACMTQKHSSALCLETYCYPGSVKDHQLMLVRKNSMIIIGIVLMLELKSVIGWVRKKNKKSSYFLHDPSWEECIYFSFVLILYYYYYLLILFFSSSKRLRFFTYLFLCIHKPQMRSLVPSNRHNTKQFAYLLEGSCTKLLNPMTFQ